MSEATYYVQTWDHDLRKFTPQQGVSEGPYTQFALRQALRTIRQMGYDITRADGVSVLVERRDDGK